MEVDERPTEQYGDIGGLDKQIQEVRVCLSVDSFEILNCQNLDTTFDNLRGNVGNVERIVKCRVFYRTLGDKLQKCPSERIMYF